MIFQLELKQAAEELGRPTLNLLLSALSAGFGIGISLFLIAVIDSFPDERVPEVAVRILMANAFAVGFIIVVLGRMDLFTEFTTIAILPVLARQATLRALARLWALVYVGNVVGAAIFAGLTAVLGPALGVIKATALVEIARVLTEHSWWIILLSATLAGWLMGALSWLISGGRDTISQVLFTWLITASIGLGQLHHAITGTAEVLAGVWAGDSILIGDFARFLLWTTLGNAAGGVVFALLVRFSLRIRGRDEEDAD